MAENVSYSHFTLRNGGSLVITLSDGSELILDPTATLILGAFMYEHVSRKVFTNLPSADELLEIVEAMDEKAKGDHNEH